MSDRALTGAYGFGDAGRFFANARNIVERNLRTGKGVAPALQAAIVVAAILQRGDTINSAGGYLRDLTRKAEAGEFSLGPMLMTLIGSRKREKKRA